MHVERNIVFFLIYLEKHLFVYIIYRCCVGMCVYLALWPLRYSDLLSPLTCCSNRSVIWVLFVASILFFNLLSSSLFILTLSSLSLPSSHLSISTSSSFPLFPFPRHLQFSLLLPSLCLLSPPTRLTYSPFLFLISSYWFYLLISPSYSYSLPCSFLFPFRLLLIPTVLPLLLFLHLLLPLHPCLLRPYLHLLSGSFLSTPCM